MASPILPSPTSLFAANRAVGQVALEVFDFAGASRCVRRHEEGSLRIRFPAAAPHGLEAVLVNTSGGMAEGDRFKIGATIGENASLIVTTAAAEKIYRSVGADTSVDMRFTIGEGGHLVWVPQETILFDEARLRRSIEVDADERAKVILAEALVFGRTAMGETVVHGCLFDRWRIRRGGKLVFAETVRLQDDIAGALGAKAVAAGGIAVATVFMMPGGDETAAVVHDLDHSFRSEVAVSAWNGFAVIRLLATEASALRHDLASVLLALGVPLPRLWLN